jgi:ubiquitin carboxyl-terminal hydrolase 22/27/51
VDLKGRRRGRWKAWSPDAEEKRILVENYTKSSCLGTSASLIEPIRTDISGVRPLLNLSQTCFLSAILQALIANPMLRQFFLGKKHDRDLCPNARGLAVGRPFLGTDFNGDGKISGDRERGCMCCEMDRAFEEVS